jgi:hypothetical protein
MIHGSKSCKGKDLEGNGYKLIYGGNLAFALRD